MKGTCNIIDSFTIPGTVADGSFMAKFNSTKPLIFYSLFPGQKIFLSVYHPTGSLEGKRVEGSALLKISLTPKVTSLLPDHGYCQAVEDNFFAFAKAQKEYDHWYVVWSLNTCPLKNSVPLNTQFVDKFY